MHSKASQGKLGISFSSSLMHPDLSKSKTARSNVQALPRIASSIAWRERTSALRPRKNANGSGHADLDFSDSLTSREIAD